MPVVYSINRYEKVISDVSVTTGAAAVQISGGVSGSLVALTALGGATPSQFRQAIRLTNNSSGATIYLGSASNVTTAANWFKSLLPGEMFEYPAAGTVQIWAIASASSTPLQVGELQ